MFDVELKLQFRLNNCNIVEMTKDKVAIISKGTKVLKELQSDEEFEKLLNVKNWAVTQTLQSEILLFDLDSNNYNKGLDKCFNQIRDKYVNKSEHIHSKHGFIKVTNANHQWCVEFAKRYHNSSGIEIYAESHWVIFAGIYYNTKNIDDPKRETTWNRIDDSHVDCIMEFTKEDLDNVFGEIKNENSSDSNYDKINGEIPAGQGLRHTALLKVGFLEAKILIKKKEILNSDSLYQKLINTKMIEGMEEYQKDQPNHQELQNVIDFIIDHVESDISFAQDYLQSKNEYRFCHILDNPIKEQFNTWYWGDKKWSENTAHYILEKLLPLKSEEFKPSSSMALTVSNNISASELTLKIDLASPDYVKKMMSVMTNTFGEYFDLKTGEIKNVDPSIMFYKNPQLKIQFDNEIEEPLKFLDFIKERFNDDDGKILLDHLAGSLLHTTVLGSKPKILFIRGNHSTWKSLIIEIIKKIVSSRSISMVTSEQLGDKFGLSLIAEKIINYSEEQNAVEPKDPASLKNAVTLESGYVTPKYSPKPIFVSRFPRHLTMCNKIAPIAKDDDDDSIFIRNQYIEIRDVEPSQKWRDVLLIDNEIQKIAMFLLKRASQIHNGDTIRQQTLEESKSKYIELTQGSFTKFIENNYDVVESFKGTQYEYMWNHFKKITKQNISKGAFESLVEDAGYVKSRDRVYRITGEPNVFTEIGDISMTATDRVMVTIVKGLRPKLRSKTPNPNAKSDESIKSDGGLRPTM